MNQPYRPSAARAFQVSSPRYRRAAQGALAAMVLSLLPVPAGADERGLRCESNNGRYRYCRVDTDNRVSITRQLSSRRCILWQNWGYDRRGVWVDRGCRAEFRVGRDGGISGGQAAAIGAIAGAVILGAVIANKKGDSNDRGNENRDPSLPDWVGGTYRGFDSGWNGDIELTVYSTSAVEGVVVGRDNDRFTGRFEKDRLFLGPDEFKVKADGDGFIAKHVRDSKREIRFRKVN
jgi:hypothetical protein